MPLSEAHKRSNARHDRESWEYISYKARIGTKARIDEAAAASGMSINGFIRQALGKAVMEAIGKPLELPNDEMAMAIMLRILKEEVKNLYPMDLGSTSRKEIEDYYGNIIRNEPSLYEELTHVLSSDITSKAKAKQIRHIEIKKREDIRHVIRDYLETKLY